MSVGPAEGSPPAIRINGSNEGTATSDNMGTPPVGQDGGQSSEINPVWQSLLDKMPSQLHTQITPVLKEWDEGVNTKLREVHSRYEPYKAFAEANIPAERLNEGYAIIQALNEDPQHVINAIREFYKLGNLEQGQQTSNNGQEQDSSGEANEPEVPFDLENHPAYQELKKMTDLMAQQLIQQKQNEEQAVADEEFEKQFAAAKDKHGDFDEQYVANALIAAYHAGKELSVDQAVQQYKQFVNSITQNLGKASQSAPVIMGAGGGTPTIQVPASSLDRKGRVSLIEQMLAAAKTQGG